MFNPKRGQLDTGLSVSENQGVGRTEYGLELPPKIFKAMQGEFLDMVKITPMQVDLRAEVKSPGGKLLATCTSSSAVMRRLKG
ncbi:MULTISPECIES: hypothetical protein [unclassified Methylobacter]|uniref:hypothetical protein n=1 Tax=unclassified Methylobacter TaxID=2635283 RepID=UPI0018961107|nr:hypothetical protein [Methylobacter sp. BlB1]MBF6649982.1 hypothetical protein [Methylobacter sp. BlB1]